MFEPHSLVEDGVRHYGRLPARPVSVNPLDEFRGARRLLRRTRLKEWAGFTVLHPDMYASMILQDAKYLASSEIYVHDRADGALYQHEQVAVPGAVRIAEQLIGSSVALRRKGYAIGYEFGTDRHRIEIDIAATAEAPAFSGRLELLPKSASPALSVSSRLPGGTMYTNKALFPIEGALRVGEREFVFRPDRDLAILDEHKSALPYRTTWTWGTFGAFADGVPVGANFVDRPEIPGQPEESGIWTPDAAAPLTDVDFDWDPAAPLSPWQIRSADRRLDVTFTPEGRKTVDLQLGVLAMDYFQAYGTFAGTLDIGTRTVDLADVHGVCEQMRARL
ncbi:DUF2804 family protein [Nocardia sp. alder85J]|uniref:DUF2804 family protein n=1 Tax=Nocardia sp. alder85J TaxID=2862949 RepID=UPI001CD21CC8|nr:DUF2804 family protein [Nocardia sp. alder85J]MCX4090896.1 DUF2804 family protein [Nocardia sp. alder85J]